MMDTPMLFNLSTSPNKRNRDNRDIDDDDDIIYERMIDLCNIPEDCGSAYTSFSTKRKF